MNRFITNISLTGTAALPSLDGAPPVSDYTFSLYVSDDMMWSDDDVKLYYHISRVAGADLAKGIPMDGTRTVNEIVEGKTKIHTHFIIYRKKCFNINNVDNDTTRSSNLSLYPAYNYSSHVLYVFFCRCNDSKRCWWEEVHSDICR